MTRPRDLNDLQTAKNRKSLFAANVSREDHRKQDARMAELEAQEMIDEKRAAIQSIDVKAWHCSTCKEYFEDKTRMELCVSLKHEVKQKEKVQKVRVQCENCKRIEYGVGSTIPDCCDKCGHRMIKVNFFKTASSSGDTYGRPEMRLRETDKEMDDGPSAGEVYAPLGKSVGQQMVDDGD
jgi:ribosomal protein L37AE/L43A